MFLGPPYGICLGAGAAKNGKIDKQQTDLRVLSSDVLCILQILTQVVFKWLHYVVSYRILNYTH